MTLWYDSRSADPEDETDPIHRISNLRYTGIVLYRDTIDRILPIARSIRQKILHVETQEDFDELCQHAIVGETLGRDDRELVISSPRPELLDQARERGLEGCLRVFVDDAQSLHTAIDLGSRYSHVMIRFRDPTNIPLELCIATLQATNTTLIKEIGDPSDVEDALVALGVMEVGADGVMFSPRAHDHLDAFCGRLEPHTRATLDIEPATIVRSVPVGMGYRSCIDLTTMFSETEGMIVGSTSQGGILCCPEVFFLPYMELRPFRVNAGAVHSYVYNAANRTDYMTELRAGSPVMVTDLAGNTRRAVVGRMKTEVRPLRLIEAEFASGERINVIMQDDWHVRIFSAEGKPINITELQPGDRVLGHPAAVGRHVGIAIDEHIIEA